MRTRTGLKSALICAAVAAVLAPACWSAFAAEAAGGQESHHGLNPAVLAGVALILIIGKLAGELFERVNQPAVLGELVGGIVIGNLALVGLHALEPLKTEPTIAALAEIGVIILLFEVGLESDLGEMMEVGLSSLLVAVAGVIAPFFLGWGVAAIFIPEEPLLVHIFIGATLCATSVGITARVLKDLNRLKTREARIILGAAVIDDVLGLLILAVVAGAIRASSEGQALAVGDVAIIAGKSIAFLAGAIAVGHYLVPRLFRGAARLESRGVLLALSIAFCFLMAWVAALVGLAPIVGAFAAGLVLDEAHFHSASKQSERRLDELISPISSLLVPIFFVLMGLRVNLEVFGRLDVLGFAGMLTLVAILGKQVCSLAVLERGINRLAIGLGMIPRGEVGLIFAGIGTQLTVINAAGAREAVINEATFGAVVIMVVITTLVTPPVLKWAMARRPASDGPDDKLEEAVEDDIERIKQ